MDIYIEQLAQVLQSVTDVETNESLSGYERLQQRAVRLNQIQVVAATALAATLVEIRMVPELLHSAYENKENNLEVFGQTLGESDDTMKYPLMLKQRDLTRSNLSSGEIARRLGYARSSIASHIQNGTIPGFGVARESRTRWYGYLDAVERITPKKH